MIGPDHLVLGDSTTPGGEDLSLKSATRRHVERVLKSTDGDRKQAAKVLGITQKELEGYTK